MRQDNQARATTDEGGAARAPGLWQAALVAALSAVLFVALARAPHDGEAASTSLSRLAEVAPADVADALNTVDAPSQERAAIVAQKQCGHPLAFVTIMRSPGLPDGRIRLRSGSYFSPAFELADRPVRVALPYPAPYASGHGTIAVLGATANAVVALAPAWPVLAGRPSQTRNVTWQPSGECLAPGQ